MCVFWGNLPIFVPYRQKNPQDKVRYGSKCVGVLPQPNPAWENTKVFVWKMERVKKIDMNKIKM